MEKDEENIAPDLCKPRLQDGERRDCSVLDMNPLQSLQLMTTDRCNTTGEIDDSKLAGATAVGADDVAARGSTSVTYDKVKIEEGVKVDEKSLGLRKRGRPSRSLLKTTASTRIKMEEEDVCFICFDGGSLVLCDRRGCPKAYHPACIKRDESFFQSKATWNCGWHICSICQKASYYMCYTCTYSLCKGCIKDADYVSVRGSKGFCGICMRTIMLIEDSAQGHKGLIQVDFDDKTTWEYLFKLYWVCLKESLSLTIDELNRAKNPWKAGGIMSHKKASRYDAYNVNKGKVSCPGNSSGGLQADIAKRLKTETQQNFTNKANSQIMENSNGGKFMPLYEGKKWAANELLDFVAHMRNGDMSKLSQFDVELLLLEYIKRNNLRDPQQKCQIICDFRLKNLFGKPCVGHFEMLKLLASHFLVKENSVPDNLAGDVNVAVSQVKSNVICDYQSEPDNNIIATIHKKADEREHRTNPDEYAAFDVHNISLIFLRRKLIEKLIDDADKFRDKVVGSIVRIQISSGDQKQDMYRLVQVVGTSKSAEPYKIGGRTADIILQILNLDKKEAIPISSISDQAFTEDECRHLCQSVKCGLIKRLTVGELLEKAMSLQSVRVNDWLETEKSRLNTLRNQASEKGHGEELRECEEKLELLNSPEERQRRLQESLEVHSDPTMDPSYEYKEDTTKSNMKNEGSIMRPINSGHGCTPFYVDKEGVTWPIQRMSEPSSGGLEASKLKNQDVPENQFNVNSSVASNMLPFSAGRVEHSVNDVMTDRLWHYQDPAGRIQGPFCLMQLHKWSISGHFPPDLRVWRTTDLQGDSVLLTLALKGHHRDKQESQSPDNNHLPSQNVISGFDNNGLWNGNTSAAEIDNKIEGKWNSKRNDPCAPCDGNNESIKSDGTSSHPSDLNAPAIMCRSLPLATLPENPLESSRVVSEVHGAGRRSSPSNGNHSNPQKTGGEGETISCHSYEIRSDSEDCSDQSSHGWDSNACIVSLAKSEESSQKNRDTNNIPDLPTPTSQPINIDMNTQTADIEQSSCSINDPKPSVAEWDSTFITVSLLKPTEVIDQLTYSPPSHPAPDASTWQAMVDEPDEFNSLMDESVSDLLAEVEAMETLSRLASCGEELTLGSKYNCFSSEGMSTTSELHFTSQSNVMDEPDEALQAAVADLQKRLGANSSTSVEVERDAKLSNVSVNHLQAGSSIEPTVPSPRSMNIAARGTVTNWGAAQGNANMGWDYLNQGNSNPGWGIYPPVTTQEIPSVNSRPYTGNPSNWYNNQPSPRYGSDRFSGTKERGFQDRDSGFGKSRSFSNRQPHYGGGGNGGSFRSPPKGQRVCKFHESGYCKKGASCSYLHP